MIFFFVTQYKINILKKYYVLTPILLLQTALCVKVSHKCTKLSYPAVKNWFWVGCEAKAQTSSTWPVTISWKLSSNVPCKIEFLVDPTTNWLPFPWQIVRTDPRCSGSWNVYKWNMIFFSWNWKLRNYIFIKNLFSTLCKVDKKI